MTKFYMVEYIVRTYVHADDSDQARELSARMLDEKEARGELARECVELDWFELDEEGEMI